MIYGELNKKLETDCKECFGFCCVALYFSKTEGFPLDKDAGVPCINLMDDFKCEVHSGLRDKGLNGCTVYDCFGAGNQVAKVTYKGESWRTNPESSKKMYDAFLVMRQLHEMLFYLREAFSKQRDKNIKEKIAIIIEETIKLTNLEAEQLLRVDIIMHRHKVNELLLKTSESIRSKLPKGNNSCFKNKKRIAGRMNLIGADLRKMNLIGEDLSGALLIAANLRGRDLNGTDLIGADMRDTDIRGANLENSIFVTQMQINAVRGDSNTRLPESLTRPRYWEK